MARRDLRLLALDGGGVRGLSALIILEKLMETVNPDAPPKPCDYFDMIGGTSTGGLIAVMLGRLRMTVGEAIGAYLSLSERVFQKKAHRTTVKGQLQGRFDSDELARAIKAVVKQQGLAEDELLKDASESRCKVFVCATSKQTSETVCLTSYRTPRGNNDLLNSVTIWEACRATAAASTFFDPIAVGRFGEEFVDGATGANNPVRELWDQAQLLWWPELESKIRCLVSIGTGVPSLKPFKDDMLHVHETLKAISTDTEQTAERFRREKVGLESTGRYYRFNVDRGLEDIGLQEAKKVKEMAAATRRYISTHGVYQQIQACAGNIASSEYYGAYQTSFNLEGVPRARQFVDRPAEMLSVESALLPTQTNAQRQKIYVLRGMGGIGKTQLAVEFARRHHRRFSSVFWLDGRSKDSIKRSIASCARRISQGQIPETSRAYAAGGDTDIDAVVRDVMGWLERADNTAWLLIIDNVDREYSVKGSDAEAYDVRKYFSGPEHGAVLITTRLARLEQLGESQQLGRVDDAQAKSIFESWYKSQYDTVQGMQLLRLLEGLPLAIAQAGAYLQESGSSITSYLRFYEKQWDELMESKGANSAPLQDYPDRSIWTTWAISYDAIRSQHENTANLLLLWSFLDNKDLWHGMFAAACRDSRAQRILIDWIGDIAKSELAFSRAMQLLRNFSLAEKVEETGGYATHPVVHRWAYYYQGEKRKAKLSQIAVVAVGWAVPDSSTRGYSALQRRLMPHAQVCSWWARYSQDWPNDGKGYERSRQQEVGFDAVHLLAILYADQGKLGDAEDMYERALRGYEEVLGPEETLGPNHTSTLNIINNLGALYRDQGRLGEAEQMYERALRGKEEALGPNYPSTLNTVNNLGDLYKDQGRFGEAEKMYERALQGKEEALGPNHPSTLETVNNLGNLYKEQGRLGEAEKAYERALRGKEEAHRPNHPSILDTVNNLGNLYAGQGIHYAEQGKLDEAEAMYERAEKIYERALQGKEKVLRPNHTSILDTVGNLGNLYKDQGNLSAHQGKQDKAEDMYKRAEKMYERVLQGHKALGPNHTSTLSTLNNMGLLYAKQGKLEEAENMYKRALQGYELLGPNHTFLHTVSNLGDLYMSQGKLDEAEKRYERALQGYKETLGDTTVMQYLPALNTLQNIGYVHAQQEDYVRAHAAYTRALPGLLAVLGHSSDRCARLVVEIDALATLRVNQQGRLQPRDTQETLGAIPQRRSTGFRIALRKRIRKSLA